MKTQQTDLMFSHNPFLVLVLVLGFYVVLFVLPLTREKGENRIMAKHEVRLVRFHWDDWHVVSTSVV